MLMASSWTPAIGTFFDHGGRHHGFREAQGWFSSAILRLAGVGLPIDFMHRRQVEMVIPFAKVLWTKPGRGEVRFVASLSVIPRLVKALKAAVVV
jgi:hypothetical protein